MVRRVVYALVLLGFAGGLVKVLGGMLHGSRSLLVDALTSFANIVALLATIKFYRASLQPPDTDHPYGHSRLGFGGTMVTMIAYGYVAGIASMELVRSTKYVVDIDAVYYALLGLAIYGSVVAITLRLGGFFKAYGVFTISELYESLVVLAAVVAGAIYSYIIDYIGAIGLTLYIFYELVVIGRETFAILVDRSAPSKLISSVRKTFEEKGYQVKELRVRRIAHDQYHGDIRVKPKNRKDPNTLYREIRELKERLKEKHKLDLIVEVEPEE